MGFSVEHVYKTMRVMRFAPELAGKVMDGSKTVSRRRSSYEPGSLCAIECEGERLGTLAVTSVREDLLEMQECLAVPMELAMKIGRAHV